MEWTVQFDQHVMEHFARLVGRFPGIGAQVAARMQAVAANPDAHLAPVACATTQAHVCYLAFPGEFVIPIIVTHCLDRLDDRHLLRVRDGYLTEIRDEEE